MNIHIFWMRIQRVFWAVFSAYRNFGHLNPKSGYFGIILLIFERIFFFRKYYFGKTFFQRTFLEKLFLKTFLRTFSEYFFEKKNYGKFFSILFFSWIGDMIFFKWTLKFSIIFFSFCIPYPLNMISEYKNRIIIHFFPISFLFSFHYFIDSILDEFHLWTQS